MDAVRNMARLCPLQSLLEPNESCARTYSEDDQQQPVPGSFSNTLTFRCECVDMLEEIKENQGFPLGAQADLTKHCSRNEMEMEEKSHAPFGISQRLNITTGDAGLCGRSGTWGSFSSLSCFSVHSSRTTRMNKRHV